MINNIIGILIGSWITYIMGSAIINTLCSRCLTHGS
jgi:hypothetical protein